MVYRAAFSGSELPLCIAAAVTTWGVEGCSLASRGTARLEAGPVGSRTPEQQRQGIRVAVVRIIRGRELRDACSCCDLAPAVRFQRTYGDKEQERMGTQVSF